jgi:hypothetical protein
MEDAPKKKKLVLKKQVLRNLTDLQLKAVDGGAMPGPGTPATPSFDYVPVE